LPDDDTAEGASREDPASGGEEEPPFKRQKITGAQRKKIAKEEKRKNRGANKGRKFGKVTEDVELCWKLASGSECEFGEK